MSWAVGIDFGTSRSAGATGTAGADGRVLDVSPLEMEGNRWIASAVLRTPEGELVVGAAADNLAGVHPDRLERTPKRALGSGAPILVGGAPLDPVDAAAAVISMIVAEGRLRAANAPPDVAVLTHPVRWAGVRREALRAAGERAGLGDVVLVEEPVAAAIHYAAEHVAVGAHAAVYDLGGGTFDTAVLLRTEEGFEVVGEPGGDEFIGGEDFDHRLFRYFGEVLAEGAPDLWEQMLTSDERRWKRAALDLLVQARRAKEALSSYTSTQVFVPVADRDIVVNRSQFESMIIDDVERTVELMEETVHGAGLEGDQLAAVFLVGGSSRVPLVATMVAERFGGKVVTRDEPKAVVALGAARLGATILGTRPAVASSPSAPPAPVAAAPAPAAPVPVAPLPAAGAMGWAPPQAAAPVVAPATGQTGQPLPTPVTVHPPSPALVAEAGPSPVTIAWRVALAEPAGQLLGDPLGVYFGGPGGVVRCVDPATGTVRWQQALGVPIWAAPAAGADVIVAGAFDGRLTALDRATGALRWQSASGGPIACAPVVAGGLLLAGNDAGHLLAFDLGSGTLRWDLPVGAAVRADIVADETTAIVATIAGQIYAVDVASGVCRWGYKTGGAVFDAPAICGDRVVAGGRDGIVYGLRMSDGHPLYGIRCGAPCVTPVATAAGLVGMVDERGTLHVHRADTGQQQRVVALGTSAAAGITFVTSTEPGFAVVETGSGEVVGVELSSGAIRFRVLTGKGNRCVPVASGRLAIVATAFDQLYGIVVPHS